MNDGIKSLELMGNPKTLRHLAKSISRSKEAAETRKNDTRIEIAKELMDLAHKISSDCSDTELLDRLYRIPRRAQRLNEDITALRGLKEQEELLGFLIEESVIGSREE